MDFGTLASVLIGLGALGGLGTGLAALWRQIGDRKLGEAQALLVEANAAQLLTQAAEILIQPLNDRIQRQEDRISALEQELARKDAEVNHRDDDIIILRLELQDARTRLAALEAEVLRLGGNPSEV